MTSLKVLGWGHRRAIDPLRAAIDDFRRLRPDVTIELVVRPLSDFEHQGIDAVARLYDMVVYDHPFSGDIAAGDVFLPLDARLPAQLDASKDSLYVGPTLRSYQVHRKSGLMHNEARDEADALDQARRFLSYLPRSVRHPLPVGACTDDPRRADDWLKDAIPHDRRKIYDPRKILASVLDRDSVFEIGRYQGGSVITALARLNGVPVGVIANDPKVQGGAMTLQAAAKMERHVKLCSLFGLPVVNFVDQPGNQTGLDAELGGTLLGALRVGVALNESRSPWISILVPRCFGMAGALHGPKYGERLNYRFAWPSARWGSIPIEGGVMATHKGEIEAAADPAAKRQELEEFYLNISSPLRTAEKFGILDVIDPRETRPLLCNWVSDAWSSI